MFPKIKKYLTILLVVLIIFSIALSGCSSNQKGEDMSEISLNNEVSNVIEILPLTDVEFKSICVGEVDYSLAEKKHLSNNNVLYEKYYQVSAAYNAALNYWLCKDYRFNLYQEAFVGQDASFTSENVPIAYKKNGAFGRDNVYIRNTAFVERLSESEIALLYDNIKDSKVTINQDIYDLVKNGWKDILQVNSNSNQQPFNVVYDNGALTGVQMARSDALVVMIGYDLKIDGSESLREDLVNMAKDLIESELSKSLSSSVSVIIERA